eukprot:c20273_g1_i2.p1 GENE.c20273_g1_i2~~c20273_g1_i2.p1  ORF type:complete len:158 (+),score=61.42 c20273_g1_i2:25-474(+)
MSQTQVVKVGVAVLVLNKEKPEHVLVGVRKGSHGAGKLALPGGHLEFGESFEECSKRELMEETGLELESVSTVSVTNDVMTSENKHYVTVFLMGVASDLSKLELKEPNKCEEWKWISWTDLSKVPEDKLFIPLLNLLKANPSLSSLTPK